MLLSRDGDCGNVGNSACLMHGIIKGGFPEGWIYLRSIWMWSATFS
jgi:hypothetical protein